jgi:hypothetical protein
MQNRFEDGVLMLAKTSPEVKRVFKDGAPEAQLESIGTAVVEGLIMKVLSNLKTAELIFKKGKALPSTLVMLIEFLKALVQRIEEWNGQFVASALTGDIDLLYGLLTPTKMPASKLQTFLDAFPEELRMCLTRLQGVGSIRAGWNVARAGASLLNSNSLRLSRFDTLLLL